MTFNIPSHYPDPFRSVHNHEEKLELIMNRFYIVSIYSSYIRHLGVDSNDVINSTLLHECGFLQIALYAMR